MKDIAELRKRVEDAGDHFGRMAEQQRANGQRMERLLEHVDKELARNRTEIERLGGALSGAEEENGQLRGLLNTLLAAAEVSGPGDDTGDDTGDEQGVGETISDLEARIGAFLSERDTARSDAAYYLGADGNDEGDVDGAGDEDDVDGTFLGDPSPDSAPAERAAYGPTRSEPSEGTDPSPEDLGAVNRIMQRISLLTGDFVDQEKSVSRASSGSSSEPSSGAIIDNPALKAG